MNISNLSPKHIAYTNKQKKAEEKQSSTCLVNEELDIRYINYKFRLWYAKNG